MAPEVFMLFSVLLAEPLEIVPDFLPPLGAEIPPDNGFHCFVDLDEPTADEKENRTERHAVENQSIYEVVTFHLPFPRESVICSEDGSDLVAPGVPAGAGEHHLPRVIPSLTFSAAQ